MDWMDTYTAQIVVLSSQISWSESVDRALTSVADGKTTGTKALEGLKL